ncbi:MAG: hypothetical protein ACP5NE_01770 [Candidatus Micrarchaeia archaeon]
MPIKYNLTWADTLSNKIHKVSQKDLQTLDEEDRKLARIGTIIASFASSHSWQTYKAMKENHKAFSTQEVKDEFLKASSEGWKSITYTDISEIAKEKELEQAFDSWLFFNVEKKEQKDYKLAWETLKQYFGENCDDVAGERD